MVCIYLLNQTVLRCANSWVRLTLCKDGISTFFWQWIAHRDIASPRQPHRHPTRKFYDHSSNIGVSFADFQRNSAPTTLFSPSTRVLVHFSMSITSRSFTDTRTYREVSLRRRKLSGRSLASYLNTRRNGQIPHLRLSSGRRRSPTTLRRTTLFRVGWLRRTSTSLVLHLHFFRLRRTATSPASLAPSPIASARRDWRGATR